jgi:taurine--2-oxoglutarate transaminase
MHVRIANIHNSPDLRRPSMPLPESRTVLHTWGVPAQWDAPEVAGGAGAWFWDRDGRRYLDMSSLSECCNLGHQHPAVIAAIRDQAERLCYTTSSWGAEPRARLAERLLERSGFAGGRVYFTLGGTDANESAVKFARWASGKDFGLVITRDRSYHGASYAGIALSGDERTLAQKPLGMRGVVQVPPPYDYRCPFGSRSPDECALLAADAVGDAIARESPARVAAVLMEPDAGTNGVVAPDGYWPALRAATRKRSVYLIADEVMSGFGRCGEWFAWQRHGEAGRPDLMTLAKGLTGAHLPLGAVVMSAEVAGRLEQREIATGLTYGGHPLCCAAGLAALGAYEDEHLIERSRALGRAMHDRLLRMQERHAVIGEVRGGRGLFAVLELVRDRGTRAPLSPWDELDPGLRELLAQARAEGVCFAARGNLILLAPPLVIAEQDLDHALALLDRLLAELGQRLHRTAIQGMHA